MPAKSQNSTVCRVHPAREGKPSMTPKEYFKAYRKSIGFTNQADAKAYLGAKDLIANIDYEYIDNLFIYDLKIYYAVLTE